MRLKKLKRTPQFCGPAIVSYITGASNAPIENFLKNLSGQSRITGTNPTQIKATLEHYGYEMTTIFEHDLRYPDWDCLNLPQWLEKRQNPEKIHALIIDNHWVLVLGNKYACGITGRPVRFSHKNVDRKGRITGIFLVEKIRPDEKSA